MGAIIIVSLPFWLVAPALVACTCLTVAIVVSTLILAITGGVTFNWFTSGFGGGGGGGGGGGRFLSGGGNAFKSTFTVTTSSFFFKLNTFKSNGMLMPTTIEPIAIARAIRI